MVEEGTIDDLIASLYDAAIGGRPWHEVLQEIMTVQRAADAALFVLDKTTRRVPLLVSPKMSPEAISEYDSEIARLDERILHQQANRHLRVVYDYMHTDEAQMDSSPYYDWLRRMTGTRYSISAVPIDNETTMSSMVMLRTAQQGHVDEDEIRVMRRLVPHVSRAVALHLQLANIDLLKDAACAALEQSSRGTLFLDVDGTILYANAPAQAILAAGDAFCCVDGRLGAIRSGDNSGLRAAHSPLSSGATLSFPRSTGRRPYCVSIVPIGPERAIFGIIRPAWLVLITDPEAATIAPEAALRLTFGLTPQESRLAAYLAAGGSLDKAAEELGIAIATARVHLRHVFRKTGTARQGELVALLARLTPRW